MAAIAPYYINGVPTVDAQIGLNADLTGQLIDSFTLSAERNEIEHQKFNSDVVVHIANTPKFTATITAKVLARTTGITNNHPGTAIARSTIPQFRSGTNHGFDITEGWWILGNVSHTQPRGDLDEISYPLRMFGFATNNAGTLISTNPS